jgi:hypothetical protein
VIITWSQAMAVEVKQKSKVSQSMVQSSRENNPTSVYLYERDVGGNLADHRAIRGPPLCRERTYAAPQPRRT